MTSGEQERGRYCFNGVVVGMFPLVPFVVTDCLRLAVQGLQTEPKASMPHEDPSAN